MPFNIGSITKRWLDGLWEKLNHANPGDAHFHHKKLHIEKGNYNLPVGVKKSLYKNRYYFSQKYRIKYFVEDEVQKAIKLSSICKYVFLITHKYNEEYKDLPFNVVRVNDWNEIYEKIKELS